MSELDDKVVQGGIINLDDLLKLLGIKERRGEANYYLATISFAKLTCANCDDNLGIGLRHTNNSEIEEQVIFKPCTRVVLGTDHKISGIFVNTILYFCLNCLDNIPEALAEHIPEIKDHLQENSIIHMPEAIAGKGCWITVTEFPMGYKGKHSSRFLNYQTDSSNFKSILQNSFLRAYTYNLRAYTYIPIVGVF